MMVRSKIDCPNLMEHESIMRAQDTFFSFFFFCYPFAHSGLVWQVGAEDPGCHSTAGQIPAQSNPWGAHPPCGMIALPSFGSSG
jgi:hypothetical protein